jgi:hypothetical protein
MTKTIKKGKIIAAAEKDCQNSGIDEPKYLNPTFLNLARKRVP